MTKIEEDLQNGITDTQILIDDFFASYPEYNEQKDLILPAWNFLIEKTTGVLRSSGRPYHLHPLRVACILAENHLDYESVIAGFFHNLLEAPGIDEQEIEDKFGKSILSIIRSSRRITNLKIKNKTIQQADSFRKMLFAMIDDIRVILVKLADRLDRIRNLKILDTTEQKEIAQEVIEVWAPLANRLGMSSVKVELEDLSLKALNPEVFQQIKKVVSSKKTERSEYLEKAQKEIYKAANRLSLEVTVNSRAKHFYSIYQKMRKRNKSADELFDLLAIRIICESPEDCYMMIGQVHNLWKPLEGRFKDYIAMPKANGYQSLHTTVICEGKPLEIQIRTKQMHSVAEHGVASHWLYKKGTNKDSVSVDNLSIINQLKELRKNHLQDEEFFNEIKEELLGDSIFVFTPNGEVRELPAGATAIDFAYSIHSHIGETIVGAKADGQIIPLSKPLKNTQIIEVLTSPQAHPTFNQLQLVKTAKARSKIRGWLQNNGFAFETEKANSNIISESQKEQKKQSHKSGNGKPLQEENDAPVKIRIGDTTNFMIHVAKCCNPRFGDEIVGYVSRGRGIIVHKKDCRNFERIPNIEERYIPVIWEEIKVEPKKKK